MVVPATVGATPHANHPLGVRHLVVALPHRARHFVGDGTRDNHDVGLPWGGAEDDAQAVLVVAWHGDVHHLDAAAGEAEGEGPEGAVAGPVGEGVEAGAEELAGRCYKRRRVLKSSYRTCSTRLEGLTSVERRVGCSVWLESFRRWVCVIRGTFRVTLDRCLREGKCLVTG